MTLIIGIKCSDGLVLGADGAATFVAAGQSTIRQPVRRKLHLSHGQAVVGVSGSVGIGQRIVGEVDIILETGIPTDPTGRNRVQLSQMKKPHHVMNILRQVVWGVIQPELEIGRAAAQHTGNPVCVQRACCSSLIALIVGDEPCLFQFDEQGMPDQATEDLPFVSIGSGQLIADPFLAFLRRIYWPERLPNIRMGILATVWALHQAIETNAGGVGPPMRIVTVQRGDTGDWEANEVPEEASCEDLEFIRTIENQMRGLIQEQPEGLTTPPPRIPEPTPHAPPEV